MCKQKKKQRQAYFDVLRDHNHFAGSSVCGDRLGLPLLSASYCNVALSILSAIAARFSSSFREAVAASYLI
jgi:hypothetical protein